MAKTVYNPKTGQYEIIQDDQEALDFKLGASQDAGITADELKKRAKAQRLKNIAKKSSDIERVQKENRSLKAVEEGGYNVKTKSDFDKSKQNSNMSTGDKTEAGVRTIQALNEQRSSESQTTDTGTGALEAGLTGATTGAVIGGTATAWSGPGAIIGAGVGAAVGGTMGALKAKSARKAAQRKAAAEAQAAYRESLANIELDKSAKINAALQNMQVGFQNSLLRKLNVRL